MKKRSILLSLLCLLSACSEKAIITVDNLRCEYLTNPIGLGITEPCLSWEISSDNRGVKQKAYHILVASSMEKLEANEGDLWDSGEVPSETSILVAYKGKPLESRMECYWKVKITTNQGTSTWSQPAFWTIGLLHEKDWQAKWTGLDKIFKGDVTDDAYSRLAARYFRKDFSTDKKPKKATLYISGLGLYKLFVNGKMIGDQELAPTPTDYFKSVKYNTFDVTDILVQGNNTIGTVLGNGRYFSVRPLPINKYGIPVVQHYGFPKMILQLELTLEDGNKQVIVSDDSWKVTADGPILANNEFDGEEYDARKEMPGWDTPGFDDSRWLQAELVQAPGGKLGVQSNPNIKIMETIKPKSITPLEKGKYILDMGQNMVGWVRLKVKGEKGEKVTLRFAEALKEDGSLYLDNLRSALVTDTYTLKGGDQEVWQPYFTYHGFRFVEITGYPGIPTLNDFDGQVVYDEMEEIGNFETSDPMINQIYQNAYWGIKGNYRGMPTDCPQRDERMGWQGDRAVGSHGESFMFNNYHLYVKWLEDIEQSQKESGSLSDVVPNYWPFYGDNMTWPAAFPMITNMLYEQYGDVRIIVKHYEAIKKWMEHMRDNYMQDYLMPRDIYGDWCMPPESPELIHSQDPARKTDGTLLGTSFYYRILCLLQRFADLQEKGDEAKMFADEAMKVKEAYNNAFFNKETAQYSNNTVTANLLSLCYSMVPEGFEEKVFENVVKKTEEEFNNHVSVGLIGIQWLMRGLSNYGRADLALKIVTNKDYPSWGYMIENGATTIWELWNGNTADPAMNSHNHVMLLGDLITWFYEYLAGIQNMPGDCGFKKITMRPYPVEGLDYVKAHTHSVHGEIKSVWKKNEKSFQWDITIPGNTTAMVYVPADNKEEVTESGQKISKAKGVKFIKMEKGYVVYQIGSGTYQFKSNKKQ